MSHWKLGSMVRINGLFHLLVNEVNIGVKSPTDPITIDPNFGQQKVGNARMPYLKEFLEGHLFGPHIF